MSELYIHNLDRTAVYQIQISAHNQVGEGPASARLMIGQRLTRYLAVPYFLLAPKTKQKDLNDIHTKPMCLFAYGIRVR